MLEELRKAWEKGLTPISEKMVDNWTFLVVLTDKDGNFYCHRYFTIGDNWAVSVDCQTSNIADVIDWCFDPRAKSSEVY